MNERAMIITAGLVLVVAFPFLLLFAPAMELEEKQVEVSGVVLSSFSTNGVTIVKLKPTSTVPIVFFSKQDFRDGQFLAVNGSLQEYQGRVEVVVG